MVVGSFCGKLIARPEVTLLIVNDFWRPRSIHGSVDAVVKIPQKLSFRSAALSREESAVSLPATSRFLADKPGFGMTRVGSFLRKLQYQPNSRFETILQWMCHVPLFHRLADA
jgi:hypothetical protein